MADNKEMKFGFYAEPVVAKLDHVAGFSGWSWVQVKSRDALNRESVETKRSAGVSAKEEEGGLGKYWVVYSLRDAQGRPRLTVEGDFQKLSVVRAMADAECPREMLPALDEMVKHWGKNTAVGLPSTNLELGPDFEKAGWRASKTFGVMKKDAAERGSMVGLYVDKMMERPWQDRFESEGKMLGVLSDLIWMGEKGVAAKFAQWAGTPSAIAAMPIEESVEEEAPTKAKFRPR